ncbi:efflux RND transporter permease subunit [Bacteriovoracaceae bacterium]|nr:efflux RND transporter permease subunit [Bacteriovoracaceae bacterium]
MKKVIDYFLENPMIVNVLTVFIFIIGFMSIMTLNKEVFPVVDFEWITIRVNHQGSSAEDVEKLISIKLERKIRGVAGLEEVHSLSGEGYSIVSLKVESGFSTDEVIEDVKDAIDLVDDLPDDSKKPIVKSITNKERSLLQIGITGLNENDLRVEAKKIRDYLENKTSVTRVDLEAYREEQIIIKVDHQKVLNNEISLKSIEDAIRDRKLNITAGNLHLKDGKILLRSYNEFESLEEIENIVIRSNNIGNQIRVKDIAIVSRVLKEDTRIDRANGSHAIFLNIIAGTASDVLKLSRNVKKYLNEYISQNNQKLKYVIVNDLSFYVKRRLGILSQNGLQGFILVFICLLFFLNLRASIMTALGAPIALLVSFAFFTPIGLTINLISMFGLIMVLGMLVDDSIIVAEQYFQHLENGKSPDESAKLAAYETIAPVSSTILTTIVSFSTLFFMSGVMGKFVWPIPAVVILCLLASWFECYFILPGHLKEFVKKPGEKKGKWYVWLTEKYRKTLDRVFVVPKFVMFSFLILFIASLVIVKKMRFELFPSDDITNVNFAIKGPVGVPFERTNNLLKQLENKINQKLESNELKSMRTRVMAQTRRGGGAARGGTQYGEINLELTFSHERERNLQQILSSLGEVTNEFKKLDPDYLITVKRGGGGPPRGKAIEIELMGEELNILKKFSHELNNKISQVDGVISSEVDFEEGKEQINFIINESEARRLGLTNINIAWEIRRHFEGGIATTITKSDEDIEVIVRLDDQYRKEFETIKNIHIPNNRGKLISLGSISKMEKSPASFIVRRYQYKKAIGVEGEVDLTKTTPVKANDEIEVFIKELQKKYPSVLYEVKGEKEDSNDSMQSFFKALIGSSFLIFLILMVQLKSMFRPIIIMSAIPLGFIGVVIAFLILGLPFSFMAMLGMLGLVGVVVNDSIVLVTFMNRLVKLESSLDEIKEQVKTAAISRFRPVILTTFTTVVGLLPIAHAIGGDPFLKPMATSFAYGLLFASLITLIFVPCFYLAYSQFGHRRLVKKGLI